MGGPFLVARGPAANLLEAADKPLAGGALGRAGHLVGPGGGGCAGAEARSGTHYRARPARPRAGPSCRRGRPPRRPAPGLRGTAGGASWPGPAVSQQRPRRPRASPLQAAGCASRHGAAPAPGAPFLVCPGRGLGARTRVEPAPAAGASPAAAAPNAPSAHRGAACSYPNITPTGNTA
jgi:hypothetical protein